MVFFCGTISANADEVRLKNGDRLSGRVLSMQAGKLALKTSYAGEINIHWAEIINITTDESIHVVLIDGSSVKGISVSSVENKIKLESEHIQETVSIEMVNVKSIYVKPAPAVKLDIRANLGINVAKGNTNTEMYHFDGEAVARSSKNRYTVGGQFNREYADGDQTADNFLGYMKYDHFLKQKWYLNTTASVEKDTFKDLNLRTTISAGAGYQFYETELTKLSTEVGLAYVNEDFDEAEDNDYPAGRWALNFDRYLFDKVMQFFHNHSGYVSLEDTSDMFVQTRTGLRFPFYKGLNLTAQYDLDWDNNVPADQDELDQRYILSLGYFFSSSP
jgi:putative salt-induced outer membrane protein YdiY